MIVSCEASSKFHRTMLPKRTFRAMLPTIFNKNLRFATVSRDRHTESYERVHPAKSKCASRYNGVPSKISTCAFRHSAVRENVWIYRPWTDPLRAHKNARFYYSFERSTPRFYWEGCPTANEICVSLQFWAIDTTFLLRGLTERQWNLRFATVSGDRHHVFTERVDREQMNICVSLQFWAIDTAFLPRGLTESKWKFAFRYSFGIANENLRFATVLGDRHHVFTERVDREQMKFAFRYSFGRSTPRF